MYIFKQVLYLIEKHYIWEQSGLPLFTLLGTALFLITKSIWMKYIFYEYD